MTETLFQHGTLAALVPGLFTGTITAGELLKHGDTGIGTLAGLDGELIIDAGTIYQVNHEGKVRVVAPDETIPFGNVHFANFGPAQTLKAASYADLQAAVRAHLRSLNLFAAIRLTGTFKHVTTRAVRKQTVPYPTLVATADDQSVFNAENVMGTLSGYFSPALYAGAAAPGFHLHFLSADHQFGGHVLAASGVTGALQLQTFTNFELHLPADDAAFRDQDFTSPQIVADIERQNIN